MKMYIVWTLYTLLFYTLVVFSGIKWKTFFCVFLLLQITRKKINIYDIHFVYSFENSLFSLLMPSIHRKHEIISTNSSIINRDIPVYINVLQNTYIQGAELNPYYLL